MRGIIIGCIAAVMGGLSGGALAQPASATDWSGFYVGGLLGGARNNAEARTTVGVQKYLDATDAGQIDRAAGDTDMHQWRPTGGLVGGYSKQFGNVVVGIEASANAIFLNEDHVVSETYITVPTAQYTIKQSVSTDWMATVRPRLGWAQENWLGYVTGGVAATQLQLDTLYTDNAFSGYSKSSKSDLVLGWSLGFGGEYTLGQNWGLRGEYLYTRFDQIKSASETTSTNNSGGALHHSAEVDIHAVMVGVVYRFKGL